MAEDDAALRELLVELLSDAGHVVTAVSNGAEALEKLRLADAYDVVLTDLIMPGIGGEAVLATVQARASGMPVIIMTAFGSIDSAVRLVRAGAFDYVTKPVATAELLHAIARGVNDVSARKNLLSPPAPEAGDSPAGSSNELARHAFDHVIAESAAMASLVALARRIAPSAHPVLLTGESGTGKEVIATAVHALSRRGAFVVVNCGAIPHESMETELFGHERGAFAGASLERVGLIEAAHGGTLFLDEIGELPLSLQPALLRFLDTGELRRVGSTKWRRFDVRVIAATNRDLESEMRENRFREDLYWRLKVLPLEVTPLRERVADVLPLAQYFLEEAGCQRSLDSSAAALLTSYAWPGNVRELRNAMQQAATLVSTHSILPGDLPPRLRESDRVARLVAQASQHQLSLREVERAYVLEIVRRTAGNKSRAAEVLGLDRTTLYRKLAEYAAEPDAAEASAGARIGDGPITGATEGEP